MRFLINRYTLLTAAALIAVALLAPSAEAQYRPRYGRAFPVVQNYYPPYGPSALQQYALQNWAYNTRVIGQTYASIPPWVYGYNPYPPVINYASPVYTNPYPVYVSPYSNYTPVPYVPPVNPYSGATLNPYAY